MRLKSILLGLVAAMSATGAMAADFTVGNISYSTIDDNTVTVTGASVSGSTLTIPATVTNAGHQYTVTTIARMAFMQCNYATVNLPETITTIEQIAFYMSPNLTSFTIPKSCTDFQTNSVSDCPKLATINVAEGNTSYASTGTIVMNAARTTLLTCAPAIEQITIPETVTTLGGSCFSSLAKITSVTIPNSVDSVGQALFENCTSLISVTLGNQVPLIPYACFRGCKALTRVNLPASIKSIAKYAFKNCALMGYYNIPAGVTEVGEEAFLNNKDIDSVSFQGSPVINAKAFSGCTYLKSIICHSSVPPVVNNANAFDSGAYSSVKLRVPTAALAAYQAATVWKDFTSIQGGATGVEQLAAESGSAVYYNLQGMRVEQPTTGIYLRQAAGKVTKVVVK